MLKRFNFQWETPLCIKEPVPKFVAYHISVQGRPTTRGSAGQLWLELTYIAENPISKKRHATGNYKIAFQLVASEYPISAADLYVVVERALSHMEIPIRRYYEINSPGIYCINAPSFHELLPMLDECAEWLNKTLPRFKRRSNGN